MFFEIGPTKNLQFPYHDVIGNLILSHDAGWQCVNGTWFKGYKHDSIAHGSWVAISADSDQVLVKHDRFRSFPLRWHDQRLTNMPGTGDKIWSDDLVCLQGKELILSKTDVLGQFDPAPLTADHVLDAIVFDLQVKADKLKIDLSDTPKKVFVSGGIDTATVLALCQNKNIDCEILTHEMFEYDRFTDLNLESIQTHHWGYNQCHHWRSPTVLISGMWGDETFMRGPTTASLWAAWHDINIMSMLNSSHYHGHYFRKTKNSEIFYQDWNNRHNIKQQYATHNDLVRQICNINVNDHQIWHLGNTITWTPFKDIELTKLILRLPTQDIVDQILTAKLSKNLIRKLSPRVLSILSNNKNLNTRENMHNLENIYD